MRSNFSLRAKRAYASLPVPDVPMSSILARSAALQARKKVRAIALTCAITLAMAGTAAAFGTQIVSGVKLWLNGNSATIAVRSFASTRQPTIADVRRIVSNATFPVTLPVGLPAGVRLTMMAYAPADRPNMIFVMYQNNHGLSATFTIFDTRAIGTGTPAVPGVTSSSNGVHWRVGGETVLAGSEVRKYLNLQNIQSAMAAISPQRSLVATQPTLSKATILGATGNLAQTASQYAAADGNAVVMGPSLMRQIPVLAQGGRPLIASNTSLVTDIPYVQDAPDYTHAKMQWVRNVALTPPAVKAVNAVMRYADIKTQCNCAIVVERSNSTTYSLWDVTAGGRAEHYTVDADTLKVTR